MTAPTDDREHREPVHIPPLEGDVVYAWPMFPNPAAGGKLFLATSWKLGDSVLRRDGETMVDLATALGDALQRTEGEVLVEAEVADLSYLDNSPFTHHVTFSGENWRAPTDWAVKVEVES